MFPNTSSMINFLIFLPDYRSWSDESRRTLSITSPWAWYTWTCKTTRRQRGTSKTVSRSVYQYIKIGVHQGHYSVYHCQCILKDSGNWVKVSDFTRSVWIKVSIKVIVSRSQYIKVSVCISVFFTVSYLTIRWRLETSQGQSTGNQVIDFKAASEDVPLQLYQVKVSVLSSITTQLYQGQGV